MICPGIQASGGHCGHVQDQEAPLGVHCGQEARVPGVHPPQNIKGQSALHGI